MKVPERIVSNAIIKALVLKLDILKRKRTDQVHFSPSCQLAFSVVKSTKNIIVALSLINTNQSDENDVVMHDFLLEEKKKNDTGESQQRPPLMMCDYLSYEKCWRFRRVTKKQSKKYFDNAGFPKVSSFLHCFCETKSDQISLHNNQVLVSYGQSYNH